MKIELKLSLDVLKALSDAIEAVYGAKPTQSRMDKVYRSIGFDIAVSVQGKYKTSKRKYSNLFDNNKKIRVSFKFHEAWALIEILQDLLPTCTNKYDRIHLQSIINDLDQKTV